MRQRSTIGVKMMRDEANRMLALDSITDHEKQGICEMIEFVLMETGNYAGYNNNYWRSVGCDEWHAAGRPEGPAKDKFIVGQDEEYGRGEFNRFYYTAQTKTESGYLAFPKSLV